jgi:cystathionine gamma-synthase
VRDLLLEPAWREEDMGLPLPDSPHACAVCLPTWDSVVGYEEGLQRVTRKLRSGYPRFFIHPKVAALFGRAEQQLAHNGERVMVFPNRNACQRAQRYVERRASVATRIASFEGLQALVVPGQAFEAMRDYWKHTGEIVSSRQAEDCLAGSLLPMDSTERFIAPLAKVMRVAADDLFVYESGMAAIYAAHRAVTKRRPGKKTLQLEFPYVDALKIQEQFGSGVAFLPHGSGEGMAEALERIRAGEFAGVFCEVPSNPLLHSVDLGALSHACRDSGTPLLVDDTVSSHCNVETLPLVDIVTTSLTKWVSGTGDVMAGSAKLNGDSPLHAELREQLLDESPRQTTLYGRDAEVLAANTEGLEERVASANRGADVIAEFLANHPAVERVWYPKFVDRPQYEALMLPGAGFGGLMSFVLNNQKRTPRVYDAMQWCKGPSLGTNFSLACSYSLLAHYRELDWAEECGVPAKLLRLSVGMENPHELCQRLEAGLSQA